MAKKKLQFIHPEIHDFRQPVIVPMFFIERLYKEKHIKKQTYLEAKKGHPIEAVGYRVVAQPIIKVSSK